MSVFNGSDIVEFAVRIEENGENFYRFAVQLAKDEEAKQIFLNLVKNAAEAMPGGGAIRVVLSEPALVGLALSGEAQTGGPARLRLTVEDNGPGIPAAALARIFESGYTTRAAAGGACHRGLGLSITRAIVAQAGGRIYATSAPGAGACIEIELPSNR